MPKLNVNDIFTKEAIVSLGLVRRDPQFGYEIYRDGTVLYMMKELPDKRLQVYIVKDSKNPQT